MVLEWSVVSDERELQRKVSTYNWGKWAEANAQSIIWVLMLRSVRKGCSKSQFQPLQHTQRSPFLWLALHVEDHSQCNNAQTDRVCVCVCECVCVFLQMLFSRFSLQPFHILHSAICLITKLHQICQNIITDSHYDEYTCVITLQFYFTHHWLSAPIIIGIMRHFFLDNVEQLKRSHV